MSHVIGKMTGFHVCFCVRAERPFQTMLLIRLLAGPDSILSPSLINSFFPACFSEGASQFLYVSRAARCDGSGFRPTEERAQSSRVAERRLKSSSSTDFNRRSAAGVFLAIHRGLKAAATIR